MLNAMPSRKASTSSTMESCCCCPLLALCGTIAVVLLLLLAVVVVGEVTATGLATGVCSAGVEEAGAVVDTAGFTAVLSVDNPDRRSAVCVLNT